MKTPPEDPSLKDVEEALDGLIIEIGGSDEAVTLTTREIENFLSSAGIDPRRRFSAEPTSDHLSGERYLTAAALSGRSADDVRDQRPAGDLVLLFSLVIDDITCDFFEDPQTSSVIITGDVPASISKIRLGPDPYELLPNADGPVGFVIKDALAPDLQYAVGMSGIDAKWRITFE